MTPEEVLNIALEYALKGIAIFPVAPDKSPLTKHGHKDATTDANTITGWWKRFPDAGIGIPTGSASGFDVLDVDARSGGLESLQQLEEEIGPLPDTPTVRTGGGGLHFYFEHRPFQRSKIGSLKGIDLKADGGYVIAPPSMHASGRRYEWLDGKELL